jgi:hypothetical protein
MWFYIFSGAKLGSGVYFAKHAAYSVIHYAKPSSDGKRYIYRANVLTGRYAKGAPSLKEPPPIDPKIPTEKYDSVVENLDNPNEFAVFADNMNYPEYLIIFN